MNSQDTINKSFHTVVVGARLPASTYNLLRQISHATKVSKSMLIRAAVTQWLKNMPADLPAELKIAITRQLIREQIETIKNLRYVYYAAEDATIKIKNSEKRFIEKIQFPLHVRKTLRQLERNIIQQQNQLDTWLKTQVSMRSNVSNVQIVNKGSEAP